MTPLELSQAFKALKAEVEALKSPVSADAVAMMRDLTVRIINLENKFRMFVARSARKSELERVE